MIGRILDPEVQKFINAHRLDDTYQLALKYAPKGKDFLGLTLPQIRSWQKAKSKLPKLAYESGLVWPPPISLEQCSSEATAKFKATLLSGKVLADLTGGTGVDTFYLSKQFDEVFFVDKDPVLCEIATHNFQKLHVNHIKTTNIDAKSFLKNTKKHFSALFIDPDRRNLNCRVYKLEDSSPDIIELMPLMLKKADKILIKLSPWLDLQVIIEKLPFLQHIYIIAVENECKEILCLIEKKNGSPKTEAVHLHKSGEHTQRFIFRRKEESDAQIDNAPPMKYIYQPNAAIMKAGAFKLAGTRHDLKKLHQHTHLYTSDQLVKNFPGKTFELIHQLPLNEKSVARVLPGGKANLIVRNLGSTVAQLKTKLNIKDGGSDYLFAVTLPDQKPALLHCRKVLQ